MRFIFLALLLLSPLPALAVIATLFKVMSWKAAMAFGYLVGVVVGGLIGGGMGIVMGNVRQFVRPRSEHVSVGVSVRDHGVAGI